MLQEGPAGRPPWRAQLFLKSTAASTNEVMEPVLQGGH